jgi:hypothetical protein
MHFYWRIIEELKYLGENWIFHDPSLNRSYRAWIRKNAPAISLSFEDTPPSGPVFKYKGLAFSRN